MVTTKELLALATQYEKLAQEGIMRGPRISAQRGDVQSTLERAGLWDLQPEVAQLIETSKIPESASIAITILVDKALNVNFTVVTNPHNAGSLRLVQLLKEKYAQPMRNAIGMSGLGVESVIEVPWLRY